MSIDDKDLVGVYQQNSFCGLKSVLPTRFFQINCIFNIIFPIQKQHGTQIRSINGAGSGMRKTTQSKKKQLN
jgi:hypothetical protein